MGVLVLMLSLAGQVMSLTVRASGQATAFTETMQAVREMERTLREDLRHVRRGRSLMVIQGNPINAYWTADGQGADNDANPANGYPFARHPDREIFTSAKQRILAPPRADLLMFFTERRANTYITYSGRDIPPTQMTSQVQQVVYGHALIGDYEKTPSGGFSLQFTPDYDPRANPGPFPTFPTYWPVPAAQWLLARRVIHLLPVSRPNGINPTSWADYSSQRFDDSELLQGQTDVLCLTAPFTYETVALNPKPVPPTTTINGPPRYWPELSEFTKPFDRSRLDPAPPPAMAHTLGHYLMPHCASFKVEWALDPASSFVAGRLNYENGLLWIDPGNLGDDLTTPKDDEPLDAIIKLHGVLKGDPSQLPREQAIRALLEARQGRYDPSMPAGYSLKERFASDVNGGDKDWRNPVDDRRPNLHVFVANRGGPPDDPVPDDIFPRALRITVDVYDKLQRLDQPIRHVMVLPVGEE